MFTIYHRLNSIAYMLDNIISIKNKINIVLKVCLEEWLQTIIATTIMLNPFIVHHECDYI